jgi:hypothetical protein
MKTETLEALAALLNANRGGTGNVHFDALTELAELASGDGSLDWSRENRYIVPRPKAPVVPEAPVMSPRTVELIVCALNANVYNPLDTGCEVLRAVRDGMGHDGFIVMVNDYACKSCVEEPEAPVVPDLRTETLRRIVAVFEAFEARKDDMFEARLDDLSDYLLARGWLDDTDYVTLNTTTAIIPLDALELVAYVLNAHANRAYLTLHDGLVRLSGYLVQTGFLVRSKDASYSIPETEAPELRIIPFAPKED